MKERTEIDTQNYVSEFYEEQRYQLPYARLYHDWWTQRMLSFTSCQGRILDNGCGTGILFETLADKEVEVVGLDISHNMIKHAKSRCSKLVLGDSQRLPFADGTFDVVVGRSLLHHLPDPTQGVAEISRVLCGGGEMVVVDTHRSLISAVPRAIAKKGKHFSDDHMNMSLSDLTRIIGQYFQIDKIYYFGYLAYPIGFPDIIDIGKYIPSADHLTRLLIKVDEWISLIPWLRTQSWGVMIKSTKCENRP